MPLALGPVHWDSVRTGACLWTCGEDAGLGGVASIGVSGISKGAGGAAVLWSRLQGRSEPGCTKATHKGSRHPRP